VERLKVWYTHTGEKSMSLESNLKTMALAQRCAKRCELAERIFLDNVSLEEAEIVKITPELLAGFKGETLNGN
jgi:hypothetical protein